jgi:Uma2 family endonuclease
MSATAAPAPLPVVYPESDGKPTADNTRQFDWILKLAANLRVLFADRPDVFVSGNQFWYPVEGEPQTVQAPDVYVVFGRPKGHRGSWKQWEEEGVPLTVVFEVLSPRNTYWEMADKLAFYTDHGVEEYYVFDPDLSRLEAFVRRGTALLRIRGSLHGHVSPRLGVQFDLSGPEMVVRYPNGRPFLAMEELDQQRITAEQQAENARNQAADTRKQATRLAELTQKALLQQATPEEQRELQALTADLLKP